jgi:hypothetical protein
MLSESARQEIMKSESKRRDVARTGKNVIGTRRTFSSYVAAQFEGCFVIEHEAVRTQDDARKDGRSDTEVLHFERGSKGIHTLGCILVQT